MGLCGCCVCGCGGGCWDCGADLGASSLRNMVFYLRQITLSIKSGDSVYAKRPLVKASLLHPRRKAPLGALTFRGLEKKRAFHARETHIFLQDLLGLTPKAAAGQGMLQDFSGVFGNMLFRLRKTTTFRGVVGTTLGPWRGWCPQACLGTAGARQL